MKKSIISDLKRALKKDKDLFYAYQSNIAMAFVDTCDQYKRKTQKKSLSRTDIHTIANNAAIYFLNLLIK